MQSTHNFLPQSRNNFLLSTRCMQSVDSKQRMCNIIDTWREVAVVRGMERIRYQDLCYRRLYVRKGRVVSDDQFPSSSTFDNMREALVDRGCNKIRLIAGKRSREPAAHTCSSGQVREKSLVVR